MTLRLVIGVDPGQTGGLAALADGLLVKLRDMPTTSKHVKKRNAKTGKTATVEKKSVDGYGVEDFFATLLADHPGADVVAYVERAGAMPGQGTSSMFNYGKSVGVVEGVICAHGIRIVRAEPRIWKRAYQIPKDGSKALSRAIAERLFPNAREHLARGKDDGRAEAILIAQYGNAIESA